MIQVLSFPGFDHSFTYCQKLGDDTSSQRVCDQGLLSRSPSPTLLLNGCAENTGTIRMLMQTESDTGLLHGMTSWEEYIIRRTQANGHAVL